ncbi:hypothetical protein [Sulfurovum sp. NBC37-1]|uniref:hypothetical protein n=1 Tax=Sulfurovum sp. (strain NBC37-1) TaxID=387093 RepID=UPI0001587B1D|nr:hypothetical protein [Sulfurovum sp. NBC37-1]BAF72468.1 hypothetical protein SUN_1517 [Sulfurovum sp. NBC37-1]
MRYLHAFMKERGYRSALIVTDPPHSRRFSLLNTIMGDKTITLHFAGSGVKWWDREHYYRNETARKYAMIEVLKIPYNLYKVYIK